MTQTYPSADPKHRRADLVVHVVGLAAILIAGGWLVYFVGQVHSAVIVAAVLVYLAAGVTSNLASTAYHFAPLHEARLVLRRIDHAAIYGLIAGTFTPFLVLVSSPWTLAVLALSWALAGLAAWHKITSSVVKSRWSTASYIGLGAIGLSAIPAMGDVPVEVLWFILAGSASYLIGVAIYVRKTMPYRYSLWHSFGNLGGTAMFVGIWIALLT